MTIPWSTGSVLTAVLRVSRRAETLPGHRDRARVPAVRAVRARRRDRRAVKPGPFRPGPVICGLLPAPLGYAVSSHCVKNEVSRALHDALFTGRCWRKMSSSCCSVMFPACRSTGSAASPRASRSRVRASHSATYAVPGRVYVLDGREEAADGRVRGRRGPEGELVVL